MNPAVVVTLVDPFGNTITTDSTTAVILSLSSGTAGASLLGLHALSANGGVATFTDVGVNKVGTGYKLTVVASGYIGTTSVPFNVIHGTPALLSFSAQPEQHRRRDYYARHGGYALGPLRQYDLHADFSTQVTLTIGTNPGAGHLLGTNVATASGGVATFPSVAIDKTGVGYTLVASAPKHT